MRRIGFEVFLNATRLCTAAADDDGVLTAMVMFVGNRKELSLEVGGLSKGAHLTWPVPRALMLGDEVTVRVVQTDQPDPPSAAERDDATIVDEAERKLYERLTQKFERK